MDKDSSHLINLKPTTGYGSDDPKWNVEYKHVQYPKPWVGLTDEEVSEYLADEWVGYSGYFSCFEEVMKWAEEKLKEKNCG